MAQEAAPPVTNCSTFRPPKNACDVHAHVFGPYRQFALAGTRDFVPAETPLESYLQMHELLGFDRGVLTQPSYYGVDNACMLDALVRTKGAVKGIVALDAASLTEAEVARLDAIGVRGVRISDSVKVGPRYDAIESIAERLRGSGWHLEIVPPRAIEPIVALRSRIEKLGIPVMVDGMGAPDPGKGIDDPSFAAFLSMVRDGLWVKLSHPYHLEEHPYPRVPAFAQALVAVNPKRCVFGLDWPHPGHQTHAPMPDDGFLLDQFPKWVPDPALQRQILVDNAAEIYRF